MGGFGPDAASDVGPTVVWLFDFFCSGIQLYVLFRPYLCFVSFLCLDFYVLGYDSWIIWGSFVRARRLFVFVHIRIKGEVGTVNILEAIQ